MRDGLADANHLLLGSRRGMGKRTAFSADHKLRPDEEVPAAEATTPLNDHKPGLPAYQYAALTDTDSIRLVRLAPRGSDDPVTFEIVPCTLRADTSFKALSYTWRPDKPHHTVDCGRSTLEIGHNLWSALRHIRDESLEQHVWIDAICIDQSNNSERAQQVQMMRQIYEAAEETIVWLGMAQVESDAAQVFELLEKLSKAQQDDHPSARQFPMTGSHLETRNLPGMEDSVWKLLDDLFWKHWFTRAWIIQEVAVSRTSIVRYGDQAIDWPSFARAADYIMQHSLTRITGVDPNRTMLLESYRRGVHAETTDPITLLRLLCQARSSYATDARDKIFALAGLAADASKIGLILSYNLDVGTIYTDLAKRMITGHDGLDLLTACQDDALGDTRGLPSWVPDWEIHPWATPFMLLNQWERRQPILPGATTDECFVSDDPHALTVSGVVYDVVDHTSDTCLDHFKLAGGVNAADHARFAEGRMLHATKDLVSTTMEFF